MVQGIFSEEMKIAQVTLIYKAGYKENVVDYRSISVLSCFSKILERIRYNRVELKHFALWQTVWISKRTFQWSCYCLTRRSNTRNFDKTIDTLGVSIDLSKAFDTVNQKILLKKLSHYGIKNKSLDWFISYLSTGNRL